MDEGEEHTSMVGKKLVFRYLQHITGEKGWLITVISGLTLLILLLQLTLNPFSLLTFSTETRTQPEAGSGANTTVNKAKTRQNYADSPLSFAPVEAQPGEQPQFLARGKGYTLALSASEAVLTLSKPKPTTPQSPPPDSANPTSFDLKSTRQPGKTAALASTRGLKVGETASPGRGEAAAVVRLKLDGANPAARLVGQQEQPSKSNYFLGQDASRWRTGVTNYGQVIYKEVYPKTDLVYYGNSQNQLEYDFLLAPGADPSKIKLNFEGADYLSTDPHGELILHLAGGGADGEITQQAPVIYQEQNGVRTTVSGRYLLWSDHQLSFEIGAYDKTLPLIIDPSISYSTFLGGSNNDAGEGIAVDSSGAAYIIGLTGEASDPPGPNSFPIKNPYDATYHGAGDIFISKFKPDGTLAYSTFLGGSGTDEAFSIAVDSAGTAYFAGSNLGGDFPMVGSSYRTNNSGKFDAIAGKLNQSGTLVYSTYLGGAETEQAQGMAIDSAGAMYLTGYTTSEDFPVVAAFQANLHPKDPGDILMAMDSFVTKINADGTIAYSTYLGGTNQDFADSIAVDSDGAAYVLGDTYSADFPVISAAQANNHGNRDLFITKFDTGGSPAYSTFLGGSGLDAGHNIAVNSLGEAIVVGETQSADFPLASPFQATYQAVSEDGFVARLNSTGFSLLFSSFFGGTAGGILYGVAVDGSDSFTVVGGISSGFPTFYAFQPTPDSNNTACGCGIIARFDSNNNLAFSSYFGGGILAVAVHPDGTTYITGVVTPQASGFFFFYNSFQVSLGGGLDAFVAKIKAPIYVLTPTQQAVQTALNQAAATGGEVIVTTFVSTLTLTSNLQIPAGVSLVGNCGPNGPDLELDGPGTITLQGNSQLIGVKLKGLKLTNSGGNNLVRCVVVDNAP
jgi:hypothetical protein